LSVEHGNLMFGFFRAALTEFRATIETGAEHERCNHQSGIPLAVLMLPSTGTLARFMSGSALKACCERVGPTMPTTLSLLIKV